MDFFGEEIEILDKYIQTGLNEYSETDLEHPIVLTDGIKTCIAILIKTNDKAYLMHLLADENGNADYSLAKNMYDSIDDKESIELFKGPLTSEETVSKLCILLDTDKIYDAYFDMNLPLHDGSIAYNIKTNEYYGVDEDENFYEYKIGYENKKDYIDIFKGVK